MTKFGEKTTITEERIDPATGEIVVTNKKVDVIVIGNPKIERDVEYIKVFPAFFSSFLQELKIHDGKARLVWYLTYKAMQLPPNSLNEVTAINEELMRELNISKQSVLAYVRDLIALKIIRRVSPRLPIYQINPDYIYRGSLVKFHQNQIEGTK